MPAKGSQQAAQALAAYLIGRTEVCPWESLGARGPILMGGVLAHASTIAVVSIWLQHLQQLGCTAKEYCSGFNLAHKDISFAAAYLR